MPTLIFKYVFNESNDSGVSQSPNRTSWLQMIREAERTREEYLLFLLLSSSLSCSCRWHEDDSMWFNCQARVLFDVAPDSDSHRFPHYTDNNRRRWITAWCTHSPLPRHTHTNTHTARQSCQGQSLPPQRNFNILTVTTDISTHALCQFTAHLRQPTMNKCSPFREWDGEMKMGVLSF